MPAMIAWMTKKISSCQYQSPNCSFCMLADICCSQNWKRFEIMWICSWSQVVVLLCNLCKIICSLFYIFWSWACMVVTWCCTWYNFMQWNSSLFVLVFCTVIYLDDDDDDDDDGFHWSVYRCKILKVFFTLCSV